MKKLLLAFAAAVLAVSLCHAADEATPRATEPIGAVVETGGVIVGKITNVVEKSFGGGKKSGTLVVAEDNGKTKVIPLDYTVEALDKGFNVVTLNQLKGKEVSVSTKGGKATKVQQVK